MGDTVRKVKVNRPRQNGIVIIIIIIIIIIINVY